MVYPLRGGPPLRARLGQIDRMVFGLPEAWDRDVDYQWLGRRSSSAMVRKPIAGSSEYPMAIGASEKLFFRLEKRGSRYVPLEIERAVGDVAHRRVLEGSRLMAAPTSWMMTRLSLPELIREKKVRVKRRRGDDGPPWSTILELECLCIEHGDCPPHRGVSQRPIAFRPRGVSNSQASTRV